ncbi:MAG: hypothetical protein QMC81_11525 [Thermoanaerobacterales bacterium]|nr:hypothetical protein [Thermoanaerobacterales bacterium]
MTSILIFAALAAVLAVFAVVGVGIRQGACAGGGGENIIKTVYIYLVLFATLMMTIGGSVGSFMALADIIAPTPYYQTIEEFRNRKPEVTGRTYTDAEIKVQYEAAVRMHREEQIGRAKNTLIKSLGWVVIPLPVFLYFQRRLAQKEGCDPPES